MKSHKPIVRRDGPPSLLTALGVTLALFGCNAAEIGEGRQVILPDAAVVDAGPTFDAGPDDTGVVPDTGVAINPFPNATVGRRCLAGTTEPYIVMTAAAASCAQHAELIDNWNGTPAAYARLPATSGQFETTTTVCIDSSGCQTLSVTFTIDTWTENAGATGRWAFTLADGTRAEGTFDAPWCDYDAFLPGGGGALASDLAVDSVKLLQGTTVTLMEDGAAVGARNAPVVEGRPGRLRVFVRPLANYVPREVVARLTLSGPGQSPVVLETRQRIEAASDENDFGTTINFDLENTQTASGLEWSVGLFETASCSETTGDTSQALFPADGTQTPLGAESMGDVFNVVLVPIRYNADGSGRLPDTSPEQLNRYRNTMFAQFPIAELNLQVRGPVDFDEEIVRDATEGWSGMLDLVLATRANDAPPSSYYYYGIVSPADDVRTYCGRACIAGLGPVASANAIFLRGAAGLGFTGQGSTETFTHEIGHATGRLHAPCGTSDADQNYPHQGGSIGAYGFNMITGTLFSPAVYTDIMGYCRDTWLSDYNYSEIFDRIRIANFTAALTAWPSRTVRAALSDGPRWGSTFSVAEPITHPVSVQYEDGLGRVVAVETADRIELDHAGPMYLLPSNAPVGAVQVRLPDGQLLRL